MQKADLLILGGTVLTLDDRDSIIDQGDIAIRGDTIIEVGPNLADTYISSEVLDAGGKLVMPGLVNAHNHAAMTLFRGLADDLDLMDWLRNHIFPAESRHMNAENVYLGTLLACIEMIRSGTTTVSDGYFFEADAARAVRDCGLRGIMAQGIVDFPCPDVPDPADNLRLAEDFICQWKGESLVKPALFCHSAYTCSPKTIQETRKLAQKHGILFGIHLAETQTEIQEVMRQYGKRPVQHLADLGILDESVMAVHCVWLAPEEIDLLRKFQVKVVHSPESNMKLASGIAPIPDLLQRGITVGLGTDGCASNNDLDLFQEMDTAAKLHKIARLDPTALNARQVVRMATMGGAEVLGLASQIGSLEPGKKADVITLDLQKPHLVPLYNLYSHLVYTLNGADVNSVVVNGKVLMRNRKLLHLEEEQIMERVRELAEAIQRG